MVIVKKGRVCNDFSTAIPAFIGIAAFTAKGKFLPISTELTAQSTIRWSVPDVLKGVVFQIAENIFFLGVISATADRPAPMDRRVIPKLFTGVPFDSNNILAC